MITAIAILLGLLVGYCALAVVLHGGAARKARDGALYDATGRRLTPESIAQRGAIYAVALILALGFLGLLLK
jgi:hypothetical protein